ncbi:MAG: hypothetical protein PVH63_05270 [Balneolaceae bacterium]|jgi:hypothetical protein
MNKQKFLLLLFVAVSFVTCSNSHTNHRTLWLTLTLEGANLRVVDVELKDQFYKVGTAKEGLYRLQLLDERGRVIKEIGFGKLYMQPGKKGDPHIRLPLPMVPDLYQVAIYKLDGSSGHNRLDSDRPILRWTLNDSLRNKE